MIRSSGIIINITKTDITGKIVLSQSLNHYETRIDKPFDAGVYIVSITTVEGVFVRKVQVR